MLGRLGATFVVTLVCAASACLCVGRQARAGEPVRILRVEIQGSTTRTPEVVRRELVTRATDVYDPAVLEADLRQLWNTGRYDVVRWEEPAAEDGGVVLTLTLRERPRLAGFEFRGRKSDKVELESVARKAGLLAGGDTRYDDAVAHRVARQIEKYYGAKGFFLAEVRYFAEEYEGADSRGLASVKLIFEIDAGRKAPVKGIRFVGNRVFTDLDLGRFVKQMVARMSEKEAEGFDRLNFERVLRYVQYHYQDSGFLDAEVRLEWLDLYTYDPKNRRRVVEERLTAEGERAPGQAPEGRDRRSMWLVPHVEIVEGRRYSIGQVTVELADVPGETIEVTRDDLVRVVVDPPAEFAEQGQKGLAEGSVYSGSAIYLAAERLRTTLGRYGRIETNVDSRRRLREEGTQVDVEFTVAPSRVYRIRGWRVRGNHKTRAPVFERELVRAGLRPMMPGRRPGEVTQGSIADARKIDLATRNIRYTGLVSDERTEAGGFVRPAVKITHLPYEDGTALLMVDVHEADTGQLMVGATMSSNGDLTGQVQFGQRNFNLFGLPRSPGDWTNAFTGAGQTLQLNATFGRLMKKYLSLDFVEPYFLGQPVQFRAGYNDWERDYGLYNETRVSTRLALGHEWSIHEYKRRKLGFWLAWTGESIGLMPDDTAPAQWQTEAGLVRLRHGEVSLTYDSRNEFMVPSKGSFLKLYRDVAGGPLGGERSFTREGIDLQHFSSLSENRSGQPYVLQFRLRVDRADAYGGDNAVPFYEKFNAGGFGTIRGYRYLSVGPTDVNGNPLFGNFRMLGTVEYTFPMSPDDSIRGGFFFDTGYVWPNEREVDLDNLRRSCGAGLIMQPQGVPPISLYFCWPIDARSGDRTERVSFNIGTMFLY